MKHIYAFETPYEAVKYLEIIESFKVKLNEFKALLEKEYELNDSPRGFIWTPGDIATSVFSDVPIPAYTNRHLVYMTPDIMEWRNFFMNIYGNVENEVIKDFYRNFKEEDILTIAGHEMVHHIDLFPDEFDEERESIWFEEGMCDYIARKNLMTPESFETITKVESAVVAYFNEKFVSRSIDQFGTDSYSYDITSIMFDYCRSFLTIQYLVEEQANNNPLEVFKQYNQWHEAGRKEPLSTYFNVENLLISLDKESII
ncbi:hypothetical protein [uncultured Psychrobacillus sp.]|uniref:hypothetical protein n=1 Tax=uncultured Psychrobacillus sp. TaxID=1551585 RepID=UPI00263343B0|nr:hypothetical protein [uncultured Psychrobacillus sp.]